jgi:hypothetical protein
MCGNVVCIQPEKSPKSEKSTKSDISVIPQEFCLTAGVKYALPKIKSHKEPAILEEEKLVYTALTVLITQLIEGRSNVDLFSESKRWLKAFSDANLEYKTIFKTVIQYAKQSSYLFTPVKDRIDLNRELKLAHGQLSSSEDSNAQTLHKLITEILDFDTTYKTHAERADAGSAIMSKLLGIKDTNANITIPALGSWYISPRGYLQDVKGDIADMWHNGMKGDALKEWIVSFMIASVLMRVLMMTFAYFNIDITSYLMQCAYFYDKQYC